MSQSEIMHIVTTRFADKFNKIAKVKIRDFLDDYKKEEQPTIVVTFLGLEEIRNYRNLHEKVQVLDEGKPEYMTLPPSMFELTYIVTPYFKTYADSLKIIGSIVQVIKDDCFISVEGNDWLGNDNKNIPIEPLGGMSIEKQMQIFNLIRTEYRPSLFYKMTIGINSNLKESFTRVEERKFGVIGKKG
jgi:hypothetical protein